MDRQDEIARRTSAGRFRRRGAQLSAELERLLGPHRAVEPIRDQQRAAAIAEEFLASYRAAEALVRREWPADDIDAAAEVLHQLSRNIGSRRVWLVVGDREPQCAAVESEAALDNPFGFAGAGDHDLRLLNQGVPAGLWFARHSHHYGDRTEYAWELETWGEPSASAATKALRRTG